MHERQSIIDLSAIIHPVMNMNKDDLEGGLVRFKERMEDLASLPGTASVHLALDTPPYARKNIDPEYKGTRKKKEPAERKFIRDCVDWAASKWPAYFHEGAEGDDIIAAFVANIPGQIRVVTGDKDLMQLITRDNRVIVFSPRTNNHVNYEQVHAHFGVYPPQILDLLALMGDASDNIKGCPGIGKVKALKLINAYGSITTILQQDDALCQVVQDNREAVALAVRLVTLDSSVKLNYYKVTPLEEEKEEVMEEAREEVKEEQAPVSEGPPPNLGEHKAAHILTLAEVESVKATIRAVWKAPFIQAKSKDPYTILAIAIQGAEMGFSPITFLQRTHILHGSICMSAHDIIGLARRADSTEYLECSSSSDTEATYVYKAKGSDVERSFKYDLDKAKKDRLRWVNKEENRPAMIRKTAGCQAARLFVPESLHGLSGVEEMEK